MNEAARLRAEASRLRAAELGARAQRLRAARKPTGLAFAIADRIALLDAARWDALAARGGFFFGRDYLAMMEVVGPENIEARYAIVADGDRPIAAVVMQLVNVSGDRFMKASPPGPAPLRKRDRARAFLRNPSLGALVREPSEKLAGALRERVLVCGNLLTYGPHGVAMAEGADPATVWGAVAEVLYRVRRAEKLAGGAGFVLLKDFTRAETAGTLRLADLSYREVETEPNMVLPLAPGWKRYDDYLASLASKYRSSVRSQIIKPIDEAGVVLERIVDLASHEARLHELYLMVQANASIRPVTVTPAYFPALARVAGAHGRCSILRRADKISGFVFTLMDGDTAVAYHIGFDREEAVTLPLYLRLLHAAVEDAISLGAKRMSLGRTALEPKARLGARPVPMTVWVRHRQPVLNRMMRGLLGFVHHDEAPDRSPFKQGVEPVSPA